MAKHELVKHNLEDFLQALTYIFRSCTDRIEGYRRLIGVVFTVINLGFKMVLNLQIYYPEGVLSSVNIVHVVCFRTACKYSGKYRMKLFRLDLSMLADVKKDYKSVIK